MHSPEVVFTLHASRLVRRCQSAGRVLGCRQLTINAQPTEALYYGTGTPPRLEYTLVCPVGGEQPRCERVPCGRREPCSRKPNCGPPSTPIRGWTVKGSRVPPLTSGRGIDDIPPQYSRRGGGQSFHGSCVNVASTSRFRVRFAPSAFFRRKHRWQLYLLQAVPGVDALFGQFTSTRE